MKIVAEGVETESDVSIMTGLGCSELQGYYFSKPVETGQMTRLLRSHIPKIPHKFIKPEVYAAPHAGAV
ncbi:MAG: hypothetical protein ABL894_01130, partial [Hyphomicrobium sp.]